MANCKAPRRAKPGMGPRQAAAAVALFCMLAAGAAPSSSASSTQMSGARQLQQAAGCVPALIAPPPAPPRQPQLGFHDPAAQAASRLPARAPKTPNSSPHIVPAAVRVRDAGILHTGYPRGGRHRPTSVHELPAAPRYHRAPCGSVVQMPAPYFPIFYTTPSNFNLTLYHGWPSPVPGCSTFGASAQTYVGSLGVPGAMSSNFAYVYADSANCVAWKLAASICPTPPIAIGSPGYIAGGYNSSAYSVWTCPATAPVTDTLGKYCSNPTGFQLVCSDANAGYTTNGVTTTSCTQAYTYTSPTGPFARNCYGVMQNIVGSTAPTLQTLPGSTGNVVSSGEAVFFTSTYPTSARAATSCNNLACPAAPPIGNGGPSIPLPGCNTVSCVYGGGTSQLLQTYARNPVRCQTAAAALDMRDDLILFVQLAKRSSTLKTTIVLQCRIFSASASPTLPQTGSLFLPSLLPLLQSRMEPPSADGLAAYRPQFLLSMDI